MKATKADLLNEKRYKERHEARNPGETLTKLKDLQRADFAIVRNGELVGLLEYKRRTYSSTRFDTFVLNIQKTIALKAIVRETGLPCTLVLEYEDGDWLTTIDKETVDRTAPVGLIGGDEDGEIVAMMPRDWFIYRGRSATPPKRLPVVL